MSEFSVGGPGGEAEAGRARGPEPEPTLEERVALLEDAVAGMFEQVALFANAVGLGFELIADHAEQPHTLKEKLNELLGTDEEG